MEDIEVYIDDIGIFDNDCQLHMISVQALSTRLQDNGFTVNSLKCEWAVQETDLFGYWLTPTGLKPQSKKIDSILACQAPTNQKELRSFLGSISYYPDMWRQRSHFLASLTDASGKSTFQ